MAVAWWLQQGGMAVAWWLRQGGMATAAWLRQDYHVVTTTFLWRWANPMSRSVVEAGEISRRRRSGPLRVQRPSHNPALRSSIVASLRSTPISSDHHAAYPSSPSFEGRSRFAEEEGDLQRKKTSGSFSSDCDSRERRQVGGRRQVISSLIICLFVRFSETVKKFWSCHVWRFVSIF